MTITVGTNSYITVADAKTMSVLLSDEGEDFALLSDTEVEKYLIRAMYEIDDLEIRGVRASSTQALKFPRANYNATKDPSGTTIIKRVQVMIAIAHSIGGKRNMDFQTTQGEEGVFEESSTYSALASSEAMKILIKNRYIAPKTIGSNLTYGSLSERQGLI